MTDKTQAEQDVDGLVEYIAKIAAIEPDEPIALTLSEIRTMVPTLYFVHAFLTSTPYEVIEFQEQNLGFKMYNRVDILAAFKKHVIAMMTNTCPDCGQPMSAHNPEEHDPPNTRLN